MNARRQPDRSRAQTPTPGQTRSQTRSQVRGLLLLALAAILFAILRAGIHNVFTPGWWRFW